MTVYCLDDGGDGTQTNTTQSLTTLDWSKAHTTRAGLLAYDAAAFTTAGNVIFFGDDTGDLTAAGNATEVLPTANGQVIWISADRTQSTPTLKAGTGGQAGTTSSGYYILDGAIAAYGMRYVAAATYVSLQTDTNESARYEGCTFVLPLNGYVNVNATSGGHVVLKDCAIDLTADGTSTRTERVVSINGSVVVSGMSFTNPAYRTGYVFHLVGAYLFDVKISGVDLSGFTNATACEIADVASLNGQARIEHCKTAATWAPLTTSYPSVGGAITFVNCGPSDAPEFLCYRDAYGDIVSCSANSPTTVARTGGKSVEGNAVAWKLTGRADYATEGTPLKTPWFYGALATAASTTFSVAIAQDGGSADLTDAEVWLEVEYMATADSPAMTLASDHRTITDAAAAQADDTTSTWTGITATYKQTLAVTKTVGEAGLYRARVCLGKAATVYVDPKVTVS